MKKSKLKKPLASIIIRTKNEEQWIESCLNKVFLQTKVPFEVILIDNNSNYKKLAQEILSD